jgi:hypothetical protein
MAVAAVAVATTAAATLTMGGNCSSRGIGEAESSKGGMVLHLQALGSGIGHGAVDEPMEEGEGEGEGGIIVAVADLTAEVTDSRPPHQHC